MGTFFSGSVTERPMKTRRLWIVLAVVLPFALFFGSPAQTQDLRAVTFVQPSPSAINSFPVFVAIGEGLSLIHISEPTRR